MRAGIYIRVSTDEQAKEGYSIDAQLRVLTAWATVKGADKITEYIDDGYSAKNLNRPSVQRMIADCHSHKLDMLIVWKLDRLARNLRDLLMLMEDVFQANGVEFVSSTESIDTSSPAGRLMLNILGAFAQNERESTSQRTQMVMTEMSKLGKHLGGRPPYGYRVNSDMFYEIEPSEAEAVRLMFSMKANGRSYDDIVCALSAGGHKTRDGKPFPRNTIYDMLRNEKYCGVYIYNRAQAADRNGRRNNRASKADSEITRIPGGMPAIVPVDLWKKVRSMSKEGKALGGKNAAKNIYLLSGVVRCGACGGSMVINNGGKNRDGSYWRVYRCKDKCVKGVEYQKLESCVLDFLSALASDPDTIANTLTIIDELNNCVAEDSSQDIASLEQELAKTQHEQSNLLKLAATSDVPPRSLVLEIQRYDESIKSLHSKIENARLSAFFVNKNDVLERFQHIANVRNLSREDQQVVVRQCVDAVTIYHDRIEITITTTATGGPEPVRTALVKLLTFSITKTYIERHGLPARFL